MVDEVDTDFKNILVYRCAFVIKLSFRILAKSCSLMAADTSLRPSPQLKRVWSSSSTSPALPGRQQEDHDSYLFETPPDLVCPITQSVFAEPVLTASGHVYERASIERYLSHNQCDPMTRQPLVNKSLTPIFVLKSRAQEYRESAAKQCVEKACTQGCADPVRYLRRAVELVADAAGKDLGVRGLSEETINYVTSHPSNAYDRLALQVFAHGLFQAGYKDKAAAVYYHLLVSGSDRVQQAHLLRCCLACWTQPEVSLLETPRSSSGHERGLSLLGSQLGALASRAPSTPSPTDPPAAGMVSSSQDVGTALAVPANDPHVFEKLVLLFDGNSCLGWTQVIDMAEEAGLGREFVVRLCEQLLFHPLPRGDLGGKALSRSSQGSGLNQPLEQSWAVEKEILLKYVRVLCQDVKEHCLQTRKCLQCMEQHHDAEFGCSTNSSCGGDYGKPAFGRNAAGRQMRGAGSHIHGNRLRRPGWLGHPLIVGGCLLLAMLSESGSTAGRVAAAVPILALLPPCK